MYETAHIAFLLILGSVASHLLFAFLPLKNRRGLCPFFLSFLAPLRLPLTFFTFAALIAAFHFEETAVSAVFRHADTGTFLPFGLTAFFLTKTGGCFFAFISTLIAHDIFILRSGHGWLYKARLSSFICLPILCLGGASYASALFPFLAVIPRPDFPIGPSAAHLSLWHLYGSLFFTIGLSTTLFLWGKAAASLADRGEDAPFSHLRFYLCLSSATAFTASLLCFLLADPLDTTLSPEILVAGLGSLLLLGVTQILRRYSQAGWLATLATLCLFPLAASPLPVFIRLILLGIGLLLLQLSSSFSLPPLPRGIRAPLLAAFCLAATLPGLFFLPEEQSLIAFCLLIPLTIASISFYRLHKARNRTPLFLSTSIGLALCLPILFFFIPSPLSASLLLFCLWGGMLPICRLYRHRDPAQLLKYTISGRLPGRSCLLFYYGIFSLTLLLAASSLLNKTTLIHLPQQEEAAFLKIDSMQRLKTPDAIGLAITLTGKNNKQYRLQRLVTRGSATLLTPPAPYQSAIGRRFLQLQGLPTEDKADIALIYKPLRPLLPFPFFCLLLGFFFLYRKQREMDKK